MIVIPPANLYIDFCFFPSGMSHVARKPVFGVCDQVRLVKPACSAVEASYSHAIANVETRDIILPRQRKTKALIKLRRCEASSAPLLFAYGINRFSHDVTHMFIGCTLK